MSALTVVDVLRRLKERPSQHADYQVLIENPGNVVLPVGEVYWSESNQAFIICTYDPQEST